MSDHDSVQTARPPFRILSLDGGGIRGAFTAAALAALERETRQRAVEHFDLVVGTSTGGIIALGLGLGLSAEEVRGFYEQHGSRIFPRTGVLHGWWLTARQVFAPKRSREVLEAALASVFGDRRLGEAQCRLVLPCYDAVYPRIYLLKTAHDARFAGEYRARAVDCALATAAAPTYFAAAHFPEHPGAHYVDGGVWANCPVMVGIAEAVHFLGARLDDIDVLSIGTVSEPFSVSQKRRLGGIAQWNAGLIEVLFRGQAEAALAQAGLLTGGRVHRIDVQVERGRFSMDDARGVLDLVALGDAEGRKKVHVEKVARDFLNGVPAPRFTPVHPL